MLPVVRNMQQFFTFFFCIIYCQRYLIGNFLLVIESLTQLYLLPCKSCLHCALFLFTENYDTLRISGFTLGGFSKLVYCLGFFFSTRQDKYGIAAVLLQLFFFSKCHDIFLRHPFILNFLLFIVRILGLVWSL